MHAPAPPSPRVCQLPTCDVELGPRQTRFCSRAHSLATGLRKITEPDTKTCQLPGCGATIVRNHARMCDAEWERRKYCTQAHARLGAVGQPRTRTAPTRRVRRTAPVTPPCVPSAPQTSSGPWRPNAPGWDPNGPRCVARPVRATLPA